MPQCDQCDGTGKRCNTCHSTKSECEACGCDCGLSGNPPDYYDCPSCNGTGQVEEK